MEGTVCRSKDVWGNRPLPSLHCMIPAGTQECCLCTTCWSMAICGQSDAGNILLLLYIYIYIYLLSSLSLAQNQSCPLRASVSVMAKVQASS